MEILTLGRRNVAFGLSWAERGNEAMDDVARDALSIPDDVALSRVFVTPFSRRTEAATPIGFLALPEDVRGPVYSAAQAVATLGRDGLYVMAMADDGATLWFCGVRSGKVLVGFDEIAPAGDVAGKVMAMSATLKLPIFLDTGLLGHGVFSALTAPGDLNVRSLVAQAKLTPLKRVGVNTKVLAAASAALVAALIGLFVLSSTRERPADTSQARAARDSYVSGVRGTLGAYPVDGAWALAALARAEHDLPPELAGWKIKSVDCDPTHCEAEYERLAPNAAYAVSPFFDRFGTTSVSVLPDGQKLKVTLTLGGISTQRVDESWLRRQSPARTRFLDWLGAIPRTMIGGTLATPPVITQIDQSLGGTAAGMPPLVREQVSVNGSFFLTYGALRYIVANAAVNGFVIARLKWSPTLTSPSWNIAWSRIHG